MRVYLCVGVCARVRMVGRASEGARVPLVGRGGEYVRVRMVMCASESLRVYLCVFTCAWVCARVPIDVRGVYLSLLGVIPVYNG